MQLTVKIKWVPEKNKVPEAMGKKIQKQNSMMD
eukprot:COSAG03_NODE_25634_length_264_cov_0.915152_1_plen_32_part_01